MSNFSLRLKELRHSNKLSQQKLADCVGMSKSSINMYERGEREPGLELLEAIADFFNVDIDYLMGKSDIPNRALLSSYTNIPSPEETREKLVLMGYRYLDDTDKGIIWGEIRQMLRDEKYKDTDFTL